MKPIRRTMLAFLAVTAASLFALPATAADWNVDAAHSHMGFAVKHMAISKVKGSFGEFTGAVTGEDGKPETFSVEVTIDVGSVTTGNTDRDDHLKGPDFFDVAQFTTMTFKSTGVQMDGDEGTLTGEFTLHGVTKTIELELEYLGLVNDPWGNTRMGFSAEGKIDRRDFGLTWSKALETGGLVVAHDVKIVLDIEVVKAK